MQVLSAVSSIASAIPALMTSKPLMMTIFAVTILSNIPTASASTSLYARCFKACMDGCGNIAPVCLPICGAACTVTLPF